MLLTVSIQNFRSFTEMATLSLVSTALKTNVPRPGQTWVECTERVAAIFGANASGKTTVLESIWALGQALRAPGSGLIFQPSAGSDADDPVIFVIDFVAQGVRYKYEVHTVSWGIAYESLHSFPKGSQRLLFLRFQEDRNSEFSFEKGATLSGPNAEIRKITKRNSLFLGMASKYGHGVLEPIAEALIADVGMSFITFRDKQDKDVLRRVILEMLAAPSEQVDLVNAMLRAADVGIAGVEIEIEEFPAELVAKVQRMIEALRDGGEESVDVEVPKLKEVIKFHHYGRSGETFSLQVRDESAGTITWLTTIWHTLNALRNGTVLFVDELDASLHPELSRYIVQLFLRDDLNQKGAQLIFTTHDVSLLGNAPTRLLQPANVWFTEKNEHGSSELFSLDEFDNRSANNNERRYLAGRFGAVPDVDDSLLLEFVCAVREEL